MKPSSSVLKDSKYWLTTVEMKLKGITMEKLARYLHMVETSENLINVKRISITRAGKPAETIDTVIEFETVDL